MNPECVNCKHLGNCTKTDTQKVLTHFSCDRFEEVENPAIVTARCNIINAFGESGLKALISPETEES